MVEENKNISDELSKKSKELKQEIYDTVYNSIKDTPFSIYNFLVRFNISCENKIQRREYKMKWNRDEIVKELEDNCPDNAFVTIGLMNPKTFKKLFDAENMVFCGEGKKRLTIWKNEAIAENHIVCAHVSTDLNECISLDSNHMVFPQTGIFTIPLIPEDE